MAEYIEREKIIKAVRGLSVFLGGNNVFNKTAKEGVLLTIAEQPAADVQEIRYGEWLEDNYGYCHCSECRYEHDSPEHITPYCPQCGAKMDKE